MFFERGSIAPDQRPAERMIRTSFRIIRQSLPENGKHASSRLRSRNTRGASHLFRAHQQRYQERRGKGSPRVIGSFAILFDREALPAQIANDSSRNAQGRRITLERERYSRQRGHNPMHKGHQRMRRRNGSPAFFQRL